MAELAPWTPRSCGHRMVLFSGLALLENVSGMRLEEKLRLGANVGVTEMVRANMTNRDVMKATLGVRQVQISGSTPNSPLISNRRRYHLLGMSNIRRPTPKVLTCVKTIW